MILPSEYAGRSSADGAKFPLGQLVVTQNALDLIPTKEIIVAVTRHSHGDWGDLQDEDRQENEFALAKSFRLFSVYHASNGTKFYIITEHDRSITTVLLPSDY